MLRRLFTIASTLLCSGRRLSFWLALSICGNAIVWLLMLNSKACLSPNAPQTIFGVSVPHDVSINLALVELAGAFVFGVMLVVAVFVSLNGRLSRPHPQGRCRKCGYDLRASTGRCPECGTPIPANQEFGSVAD